jgi:hypothetical protein
MKITHGRKRIKIRVSVAGRFQLPLRAAKFLVLHLQFNLVRAEPMDQFLQANGRELLQALLLLCELAFGAFAESGGGGDVRD